MTALLSEPALSIPRNEGHSQVVPSEFDHLISGYLLTQTALLRDSYRASDTIFFHRQSLVKTFLALQGTRDSAGFHFSAYITILG